MATRLHIRGQNNFDLIRLGAALAVLASHSYPLTGNSGQEPLIRLGYDNAGDMGVAVFFVLSGLLVAKSVETRSVLDYLQSRCLRILPALIVVTLFEVFILGVLFTGLPIAEYFTRSETWSYLRNPLIFHLQWTLPGVFPDAPHVGINGSLWTLPLEATCYLLLPILAVLGFLRRHVLIVMFTALLAFNVVWGHNLNGPLLAGVQTSWFANLSLYFLAGTLAWVWRDQIRLDPGIALCALLLLILSRHGPAKVLIYHTALPYLVVFIGLYRKVTIPFYERIGDISYGTYLYAFPIQQAIVATAGSQMAPTMVTIIAAPIVLALATLSWRCIERPALSRRQTTTDSHTPLKTEFAG